MKRIAAALLTVIMVLSLCLAGCTTGNKNPEPTATPAPVYFTDVTPENGATVPLQDGKLYYYLRNYTEPGCSKTLSDGKDIFYPKPLTISWKFTEGEAKYYLVEIGQKEDLSDGLFYQTPKASVDIEDLFTAHTYYYRITAVCENENFVSEIYKVKTEQTVRTITIPGASNTRDLGGWVTADGKQRIKQGIIYRGSALDSVTKKNKTVVLDYYGIKTELDCRDGSKAGPFRKDLNYITLLAPYYVGGTGINSSNKTYKKSFATELRTFLDPANFPVYFHCQIGRDRTGTLAFMLMTLCGVSETDLYKEYEVSHFSESGTRDKAAPKTTTNNLKSTITYLKKQGDGDLYAGAVNYCLEIGLTQEEIDTIKKNILEPVPDEDYSSTIPLESVLPEEPTDDSTPFTCADFKVTELTVPVGTLPAIQLLKLAEDNPKGKINYTWDEGAIDGQRRLTEGDHECVIEVLTKAKDVVETVTLKYHVVNEK